MKKIYLSLLGIICIYGLVILGWIVNYSVPTEVNDKFFSGCQINEKLLISVDRFEEENNKILIEGWILDPEKPIDTYDIRLIFKSADGKRNYSIKTNMRIRQDVEDAFAENSGKEKKYNRSGFVMNCSKTFIKKGVYDIYIFYGNNGDKFLRPIGKSLIVNE